ncbi:MAG: glycosyl transferase group 1 [Ferruginibacter sp.]|uniref:glycosyltransferase n=1 Tax=Ferruginibacter sp. TaxID=1940288 RepID=UPI00265861E2|nr:glycosyltransferase [Ferruginibacter sp.]MDB5280349.1 glycosyl transferase group 1 [Ferruginibacter sp.]
MPKGHDEEMRPFKIVHLTAYLDGGAGTAAYRINECLLKAGIDSTMLTTHTAHSAAYKNVLVQDISGHQYPLIPGFVEREKNRIRFRIKKHLGITMKPIRQLLTELFKTTEPLLNCEIATIPFAEYDILKNPVVQNADIIHMHWVGAGMVDYPLFFSNNKKPVVWTLHDMNPFQGLFHYKEDEERNESVAQKLDKQIAALKSRAIKKRKSDLIFVTPTDWLYNQAKQSSTFKNICGTCIAYPIDTSFFSPQRALDLRKENNIKEGNVVFLFVAHAIKIYRKGFDILVDALSNLKHLNITLLVLGNCEYLEVQGLDVRLLGSIKDNDVLRNYYSMADAFIIPSREDNLPNVMLESLACGTPVIGFPVGGIKEHIVDYKTGMLAKEISAGALANAMEEFHTNKKAFDQDFIVSYAREHFSEQLIAAEYAKLYTKILAKNLN